MKCNDIVHSDVCGPVEIHLLDGKREALDCFIRHKAAVENHHNAHLRKLTSDDGGEYLAEEFKEFGATNGIDQHTTSTYTPEQNGMAEVRFRILFDKVRTVLIDSNSPKQLWAEALLSVVYLQNRTMNSRTQKTPFEIWYGFAPDVSHFRVFGSLAYVYLPTKAATAGIKPRGRSIKRQKLDYRSARGIFNIEAKTLAGNLAASGIATEPKTYNEAVSRPDAREWKEAIDKEMASLIANKTWTVMPLPTGKRALSSRWLFKIKYNSDGSIERKKARFVVIGCQQVRHIDFDEIFAPVVRLESLRVLLAIVCIEDLECHQMDVETAFLNGDLTEEVYIKPPQGLDMDGKEEWVCKLHKSLYGLKQAPRAWHKALTSFLQKEGFEKLD
ncbi:Retrotransposon protein, Ty1-Copia subclass, partial [Phytophthora megakarya]